MKFCRSPISIQFDCNLSLIPIIVKIISIIIQTESKLNYQSHWFRSHKFDINDKGRLLDDRRGRSMPKSVESIQDGEVYSIKNIHYQLYLTAKAGSNVPGPVILRPWRSLSAQLWEATRLPHPSKGYYLKPLDNEFNSVTSQLANNAHSYHPWEFKLIDQNWVISRMVHNKSVCIEGKGIVTPVVVTDCDPSVPGQLWLIQNV